MSHLARAAGAAWRFVVGDDWRLALGVAAAIGLVAVLVDLSVNAWWLLPVGVLGLLWISVSRAARPVEGREPPAGSAAERPQRPRP